MRSYLSRDAVRDGFLMDLRESGVVPVASVLAYATLGVWRRYTRAVGRITDISVLARVAEVALKRIAEAGPDEAVIELVQGELWVVRDGAGLWTLMLPEEY